MMNLYHTVVIACSAVCSFVFLDLLIILENLILDLKATCTWQQEGIQAASTILHATFTVHSNRLIQSGVAGCVFIAEIPNYSQYITIMWNFETFQVPKQQEKNASNVGLDLMVRTRQTIINPREQENNQQGGTWCFWRPERHDPSRYLWC